MMLMIVQLKAVTCCESKLWGASLGLGPVRADFSRVKECTDQGRKGGQQHFGVAPLRDQVPYVPHFTTKSGQHLQRKEIKMTPWQESGLMPVI